MPKRVQPALVRVVFVLALSLTALPVQAREQLAPGTLLWSAPFGQDSYTWSTPVVLSDRVIIQDQEGGVTALSTSDGSLLWHTQCSGFPVSSPIYAGGDIFMQADGVLYRIAPGSGEILAQRDFGGTLPSQAPAAGNNLVYVAVYANSEYRLYALQPDDLTDAWSAPLDQLTNIMFHEGHVYAMGADLTCLDATDGTVLWTEASPVAGARLLQGAVTESHLAVITGTASSDPPSSRAVIPAQVHLYSINPESPASAPTLLFSSMLGSLDNQGNPPAANADTSPPVFADNALYTTSRNGEIHAYSVAGGSTPTWKRTVRSSGSASALPVVVDGRVLVQLDDGQGSYQLASYDSATGALLWQSSVQNMGISWSQPVVGDRMVYLATDHGGGVYAFQAADLTEDWRMLKQNPQQTGADNGWTPPATSSNILPAIYQLLLR